MSTSLQSAIEAVNRVMVRMPADYASSDDCPIDDLMHALTTMQLVEKERLSIEATPPLPALTAAGLEEKAMPEIYVSDEDVANGANPHFESAGRVHDWRNHVPENIRAI